MPSGKFLFWLTASLTLHLFFAFLLAPLIRQPCQGQPETITINLADAPALYASAAVPENAVPNVTRQAVNSHPAAGTATLTASATNTVTPVPAPVPVSTASAPSVPLHVAPPALVMGSSTALGAGSKTVSGTSSASADSAGKVNVVVDSGFGSANGPAFRKQILPVYPPQADRRGREGVVLLRLSISATGQLSAIEVLEDPGFGFTEAALEAVRASSFQPARQNGREVASRTILPIRFRLERKAGW